MRHPLVDGHGSFGGPGPDEGPAAMRYTECRLQPLALDLMAGIDEETVDFTPNYSNSTEEPTVLPARFPNLLVNGSQGIAVGMATNIPPHNLGEVIDATHPPARAPRGHPRRPDAVRQGPGLPDRRPDPRAPGHPRRLPDRPGLDQDAGGRRDRGGQGRHPDRGHRAAVPDLGRGDRPEDRRPGEVRRARRHRRGARLLRRQADPAGHPAQARRQRQRRPEQALQAHPAADELRGQHAGPGRRGAAHAQPGPGADALRRPPDRGRHPPLASSGCARPRPGRTSSRACCGPSTCSTRSSPPSAAPTTARPPGARSWPSRSPSARSRPTTSWT